MAMTLLTARAQPPQLANLDNVKSLLSEIHQLIPSRAALLPPSAAAEIAKAVSRMIINEIGIPSSIYKPLSKPRAKLSCYFGVSGTCAVSWGRQRKIPNHIA